MTQSNFGALGIVSVICLVIVAPALTVVSAPAAAAVNSDTADTYVVEQGGECIQLEPHGDGTETVEAFYDYRTPETDPQSWDYSSHGTDDIQENQVSKLFVHEGSDGTSLVFLHDKRADGSSQPDASTVTMDLSDLPSGEWAVQDDSYENGTQDDDWEIGGSSAVIDWKWREDRSDGGAYRGLHNMDATDSITVDPGFNEEAAHWGDWGWSGDSDNRTDEWVARSGDGTETELDMSESITIERGICGEDETAPNASATASPTTVAPGEDVDFDASDSTDNVGIERYEWAFDDGSESATGASVTHAYESNGTYEATLTVTDGAGNTDTDTVPITVERAESDDPPTAALDAPASGTVNETVTFDASNSTDDGEIAEYRWAIDGERTDADGPTLDRTFSQPGDHTATVTVLDESGQNDSATTTVTIEEAESDEAPNASATASPTTVAPGESVAFDGRNSTDDGEISAYEWAFGDGNGSDDATTSHAYAGAGTYEATLTVTDDAGNTDTATVPITVEATETDDPPTAALDAPASGTVNETVTFDASNSTDDGEIAEYRWTVDGADVDADGPTLDRTFSQPGDHTATVTVLDESGQNDSATTTLSVEDAADGGDEDDGADDGDGTDGDSDDGDGSDGNEDGDDTDDGSDETDDSDDSDDETDDSDDSDDETDDSDDSDDETDDSDDSDDETDDSDDSDDETDDSDDSDGGDDGSDESNESDDDDSSDSDGGSPSSGSSGGGSSGGAAPPSDDEDDAPSAGVSRSDDGAFVVTVEDAVAGESVSANVSGAENGTGLQRVTLVPATDADELNVTLTPRSNASAPTGTDAGLYELRTENGSDVRNVTYLFGVDRADLGESGELRVLTSDGSGASPANHTVVENGSTMGVEVTTDDVERVVLAAVAPDVSASDVTTDGPATVGEPVTVEATLTNDGHLGANRTVDLAVDGDVVDSTTVTVPAGGETTVSFETTFETAGDVPVSVAGADGTVSVASSEGTDDADGESSTATEVTDDGAENGQNLELALAGFGVLIIGAAALFRAM